MMVSGGVDLVLGLVEDDDILEVRVGHEESMRIFDLTV